MAAVTTRTERASQRTDRILGPTSAAVKIRRPVKAASRSRGTRRRFVKNDARARSRSYNGDMADILFPAVVIVFFALATLLVKACDLLVGAADPRPDETERA